MDSAYSPDVLARKGHWSRADREFRTDSARDVLGEGATVVMRQRLPGSAGTQIDDPIGSRISKLSVRYLG